MEIDLTTYKEVYKILKSYSDNNPNKKTKDIVREMSPLTGCHILAVAYYMGTIRGFDPELDMYIKDLKEYYTHDSIVGIDEFRDSLNEFRESKE